MNKFKKIIKSPYLILFLLNILIFLSVFFTDECYIYCEGMNVFSFLYMIFLNSFPFYLVSVIFYCATNRLWPGICFSSLCVSVLEIINKYKIVYRDEPIKLTDFKAAKEATNIMENYNLEFRFDLCLMCSILLLLCFCVIYFEHKNIKKFGLNKISLSKRIIVCVLALSLGVCSYLFVYKNDDVISPVTDSTQWLDVTGKQKRSGLILHLLNSKLVNQVPVPENYSKEEAIEILKKYQTDIPVSSNVVSDNELNFDGEETYPNIIGVMSEAFFDPQDGDNVEFYEGKNPLKNYNRIINESMYGKIVVPGFGGGTSDTEYEFLTGSNATLLDNSLPPIFKTYINDDLYSMLWYLKDIGYETHGIHPGHRWFYNRGEVYGYLGFDDFYTMETMPSDLKRVNYYIADSETEKLIEESYDKYLSKKKNGGYFNFTVTIQNHGPYVNEKTDRESVLVRKDGADDKIYYTLDNYMIGLSDADEMLGKMCEYLNEKEAPTVLVFFGDHLPFFDDEKKGMAHLGINIDQNDEKGALKKHSTPYLIWGNNAFKEWEKRNGYKNQNGYYGTISANYLGAKLLKYAHIPMPPFFKFTDELSGKISVIRHTAFYVTGGNFVRKADEKDSELLKEYSKLIYYNTVDWKNSK